MSAIDKSFYFAYTLFECFICVYVPVCLFLEGTGFFVYMDDYYNRIYYWLKGSWISAFF